MAEKIRLEDRECPLSSTLGLVGEWWTVLILHDVFDGYHRFDQFQANLGISSSLLTTRLQTPRRRRHPHQAALPGPPTPLRVPPHRPRPVAAPGARRARRLGQQPPRARRRAAWCSSTPTPASKPTPSSSTAPPAAALDGPDFVFTAGPAASTAFTDRYRAHHATHRTRVHPPMLTTT